MLTHKLIMRNIILYGNRVDQAVSQQLIKTINCGAGKMDINIADEGSRV